MASSMQVELAHLGPSLFHISLSPFSMTSLKQLELAHLNPSPKRIELLKAILTSRLFLHSTFSCKPLKPSDRMELITALYKLLKVVVFEQELEVDLLSKIKKCLEDLINAGIRQWLISLIKKLNREKPPGLGCERGNVSRGALVERQAVVYRERLMLGHCLVLSIRVMRTSLKDIKDIFFLVKDSIGDVSQTNTALNHQIKFSLLFSLVVAFVPDAFSEVLDKMCPLLCDVSSMREFHDLVMAAGNDPNAEGYVDCIRLAWAVHLMLIQDYITSVSSASSTVLAYLESCLKVIFTSNVFEFILDKVLRTAAYQNDDEDMIYMYNAYLHKLIICFLSHPLARDKVKESKERAIGIPSPYCSAGTYDFGNETNLNSQQVSETGPLPFVSLLEFVSEFYQREPDLLTGNDVLWTFVNFAGEDHTNFQTLVAFLNMLSTLASSQEGALKVFELLQEKAFPSVGWSTMFSCLSIYDEKFKQSLQTAGAMLPEFPEGDAKALVAYLNVLQKVVQNGDTFKRKDWFTNIEPLFKLLGYKHVPPYLKGALRNAIATFIDVYPARKETIRPYHEKYNLRVDGSRVGKCEKTMAAQSSGPWHGWVKNRSTRPMDSLLFTSTFQSKEGCPTIKYSANTRIDFQKDDMVVFVRTTRMAFVTSTVVYMPASSFVPVLETLEDNTDIYRAEVLKESSFEQSVKIDQARNIFISFLLAFNSILLLSINFKLKPKVLCAKSSFSFMVLMYVAVNIIIFVSSIITGFHYGFRIKRYKKLKMDHMKLWKRLKERNVNLLDKDDAWYDMAFIIVLLIVTAISMGIFLFQDCSGSSISPAPTPA